MSIKQLKPGDEIFIRARYTKTADDGDVCFSLSVTSVFGEEAKGQGHSRPENVFSISDLQQPAEKPKYDPCRKFRAGDIVEPCQVKRRWWSSAWQDQRGIRFTVTEDENKDGLMAVKGPNSIHPLPAEAVFFQLVTPVEELEPFFVYEDATSWQVKKGKSLCARYGKATHPHAKEAAEAERDRLNAEYRKEQK